MRILSVGSLSGLSNTCVHRNWALHRVADEVDEVNTSLNPMSLWCRVAYHLWLWGCPVSVPENNNENGQIRKFIDKNKYDVVWIDKGNSISPATLQYIHQHQPECKIISYSPDNMALRHNQSKQYVECLPLYDHVVTTKSYIIDDLKRLGGGAKDVIFVNNSYEPKFHYPRDLSEDDYVRLGCDIGFVGAWEKERYESMCYLAEHGLKVRAFGGGRQWMQCKKSAPENLIIEDHGLHNEDYPKSFKAFKISLCFLRKINFDIQTSRSIEIPACGGFMMAERTKEHEMLFEDKKEAVFFSSNEELLELCRYYLAHDEKRKAIAEAGRRRCLTSDYSNEGMVRRVLEKVSE